MNGWLIYDEESLERNSGYAKMLIEKADKNGISLKLKLSNEISFEELPLFAISRSYYYKISEKLESLGVRVFNSSEVSLVCNDKYNTYTYFKKHNIPMMDTIKTEGTDTIPFDFPFVMKPTDGHGGDGVTMIHTEKEFESCFEELKNRPVISQKKASDCGKDLRVYVLGNEILAGMLRVSEKDFRSNFCLGGNAYLHKLTDDETALIKKITDIMHFDYAGIDLIYDNGKPVLNEIEDIVGSRMLYTYTDIDTAKLYIEYIKRQFL